MTEFKVFREVEIGQGRNNAAENEEREKGEERHGEELTRQEIADHLNRLEINQDPARACKHPYAKGNSQPAHDQCPFLSRGPRSGHLVSQALQPGPNEPKKIPHWQLSFLVDVGCWMMKLVGFIEFVGFIGLKALCPMDALLPDNR